MKRAGLLLVLWAAALSQSAIGSLAQDHAKPPTISLAEHKDRREKLMAALGDGVTIASSRKSHDKWRPEWPTEGTAGAGLTFFYLVGRNYENGRLVLHHAAKKAILFLTGDAAPARKETGIDDVRDFQTFENYIRNDLKDTGFFFVDSKGITSGLLKEASPEAVINTTAIAQHGTKLRQIKSKAETAMIRFAAEATCRAHVAAYKAARAGFNESEIQKTFEDALRSAGCDNLSYPSIVGGSQNTPVIHYNQNNKEVKDGELILNDSAGSYKGYACDITRTFPVNGKFSELQRKQYQAVLDAQKACEKILKPGVTWKELSDTAAKVIQDAGFGDVSYARVHGLGHFVGLQTHDPGEYRAPLKAGMYITIEPGIYDKTNMISIRIEDVYLLTETGFERLSESAPREPDEVEKLIGGGR